MKHFLFAITAISALLATGCASLPQPHLGKVVDGYLVNVDENGVILQGYDPVSLREGKGQAGNPSINVRHHGATYRFVTEENKQKFLASPAGYEPEFGGYCAYGVAVGNLAPIELWTYDTTFRELNIYQHNQKAVNGWKKDVNGNYEKALDQWEVFHKKYVGKK